MARRPTLIAALLVTSVMTGACSGRQSAPVSQPVSAPEVSQQETTQPPAVPTATPAPAPVEKPAAPPKAPAPADPSPPITYPTAPPVVANPSEFLAKIEQAHWDLRTLQAQLPPQEAKYHNESGEEPGYTMHAYDGGTLRLVQGSGKESLFAVVVDTDRPGYASFRDLKSQPGYQVEQVGRYTVVIRAGEPDSALQGDKVNIEALRPKLGDPTFSFHLHGVGTYMYFYVPQGVALNGSLQQAEVVGKSGADLRKEVAAMLPGDVEPFFRGPKTGRTSPDGKRWAGKLEFGGYWNNFIVVRTPGKAEQQYQADYFIVDYFWLDDHRIIFAENTSRDLKAIDVSKQEINVVAHVSGYVMEFAPLGGNKFWFADGTGTIHEVEVP